MKLKQFSIKPLSGFIWLFLAGMLLQPLWADAQKTGVAQKKETSDSLLLQKQRSNAALFSDGLKEKLAGNDAKAKEKFEASLQALPADHAAMYELAELFAKEGHFDEGIGLMKKAVHLSPTNQWYLIRLAQLYKVTNDLKSYVKVYRDLLKLSPDNIEYIGELSSALVLLGEYDEAIDLFNDIEKQTGVNEMLSQQKHAIYMAQEKPQKAIAEMEKLSAAFPYESRYLAILADLYKKYGPQDQALEVYKKIVANDPDDPYAHIALAEFLRDQQKEDEAFESLMKAFESPALDADNKIQIMLLWFEGQEYNEVLNEKLQWVARTLVKVHPESARGYQLFADYYLRSQQWEEARKYLLLSFEKEKNNYQMWESLLYADLSLQDFDTLVEHANEVINLFPEQPLPYFFSGIAYFQLKNYEKALQNFETGRRFVVRNDQLLSEFYSNIGDTQQRLNNHLASDAAYEKSLSIKGDNALVLNNYAYFLSLRNMQLDKAKMMSEKSLQLQPDNPSYLDTYAWILFRLGDYANALIWIEKAIAASPEVNGTMLEHQGDILFHLNRIEEAVDLWKKAAQAGETTTFIQKKIKDKKYYE